MDYNNLLLKIALLIPILFNASMANAQSFEMFGIDIHSATRNQITEAIIHQGAQQLPSTNHLSDRYDANDLLPGARMVVEFTIDEKLESIVYRFDSGNLFTDVLKFDRLKRSLIEKYGNPLVPSSKDRDSDFEEELLWKKNRLLVQLVNYKWYAAWRIHVTHRLSYTINQGVEKTGHE